MTEEPPERSLAALLLGAPLLILGLVIAAWLVVALRFEMTPESVPPTPQFVAGEASLTCLQATERVIGERVRDGEALDVEPIITALERNPVFGDGTALELTLEARDVLPGAAATGPVHLYLLENASACAIRITKDDDGLSLDVIGLAPFDGARDLAAAYRAATAHVVSRRRLFSDNAVVIATTFLESDPTSTICGDRAISTQKTMPVPGATTTGCVCGEWRGTDGPAPVPCAAGVCGTTCEVTKAAVRPAMARPLLAPTRELDWRRPLPEASGACVLDLREASHQVFRWQASIDGCPARPDGQYPCVRGMPGTAPSTTPCEQPEHTCWKPVANVAPGTRASWQSICGAATDDTGPGLRVDDDGAWNVELPCSQSFPRSLELFAENRRRHPVTLTRPSSCATPVVNVAAAGELVLDDGLEIAGTLHAGGHCLVGRDVVLDGDLSCETIQIAGASAPGRSRITGQLSAFCRCNAGECRGAVAGWSECRSPYADFDCDDPGVCTGENVAISGGITSSGDICLGGGNTVHGVLSSADDIAIGAGGAIEGRLIALESVGLGPGVVVRGERGKSPATLLIAPVR